MDQQVLAAAATGPADRQANRAIARDVIRVRRVLFRTVRRTIVKVPIPTRDVTRGLVREPYC